MLYRHYSQTLSHISNTNELAKLVKHVNKNDSVRIKCKNKSHDYGRDKYIEFNYIHDAY